MSGLRLCILCIISAAFICAMMKAFLQDSAMKEWMCLLCNIYITVILLKSIGQVDYGKLITQAMSYTEQANQYVLEGKDSSSDALRNIIKENCEAYVLEKASQMGAKITVEIYLSGEEIPIPEKAEICGAVSPYAKTKLSNILTEELGITKEAQVWIG